MKCKIHIYLRGSNFCLFIWAKYLGIFNDCWKLCETCGSDEEVGVYNNKWICQDCWAKTLTPKEISEL